MRSGGLSHGNTQYNGPGSLPVTVTGVLLGQAQDDRWGSGSSTATA